MGQLFCYLFYNKSFRIFWTDIKNIGTKLQNAVSYGRYNQKKKTNSVVQEQVAEFCVATG